MGDIAELGLKIDSKDKEAKEKLEEIEKNKPM